MNPMQAQVADFHRLIEAPVADHWAGPTDLHLRYRLIAEEFIELRTAMGYGEGSDPDPAKFDVIKTIDALGDLLFVIFGAFVAWGLDAQMYFDEITRSNLTKAGGGKDKYGKAMKPATYVPPDLESIFVADNAKKIFAEEVV